MQELERVVRRLKAYESGEDVGRAADMAPPLVDHHPPSAVSVGSAALATNPRQMAVRQEPPIEDLRRPIEPEINRSAEPKATPLIASRDVEASGETTKRRLFSDIPSEPAAPATPPAPRAGGGGGGGGGSTPPEDGSDHDGRRFPPFLTWLGAAASVALVAGICVWTYKLGQRDAMDVPIVRALEGPSRIAPEDPGGRQVAHQGLSVNKVLEGGGVRGIAATVRTAPGDEDVTAEDKPIGELAAIVEARKPTARPVEEETAIRAAVAIEELLDLAHGDVQPRTETGTAIVRRPTESAEAPLVADDAVSEPLEVAKATEETPQVIETETGATLRVVTGDLSADTSALTVKAPVSAAPTVAVTAEEPIAEPEPIQVAALGPTPPIGEGSVFAPAVMIEPRARPRANGETASGIVNAAVEAVVSEAAATATAATSTEPVPAGESPIPLPAGTRMIQIGAYASEAVAEQQWQRFASLHDDLLGAKEHYVQRTNNSGKVFYRLRVAGYATKEDTRAACTALSARGLPCISVTLR